jgi:hypothetical protein
MAGKHWVQYHIPDRMGCGIDECGTDENEGEGGGFGLVTSKDCGVHDPRGDVAWVVGKTQDENSPVYLGWWFVVEAVEPSDHPEFLYQFIGSIGGSCNPMPMISDEPWFHQLLGITGNFRYGLTEIKLRAVLNGLRAAAAGAGSPQQ